MKPVAKDFIPASRIALADDHLRKAIFAGAMRPYLQAAERWAETSGRERLRTQAREARVRALRKLPELLERLEKNLLSRGAKVLWAADAEEANRLIAQECVARDARLVVKGKSMVTEETGLNQHLERAGMEVVESDLGEFIIQLAGETPSHIIAPVLHKSKDAIAKLFSERLGLPLTDDPAEMMRAARSYLREKFLRADVGISGVNLAVAETGGLVLVTNEGNGRMVTTLPRTHIAVMGLERVVESWKDLASIVQLLPRVATGQSVSTYVSIIHGPRQQGEPDGPEELVLVIVDNGRSAILNSDYAESLLCIRCGACLNACPVYRRVGGHAYGWVYPGPIGSVISPLLLGLAEAPDLPMASSLCGACRDACPVKIDLPEMLVRLRAEPPMRRKGGRMMSLGMKMWRYVMLHPSVYRWGLAATRFLTRPWHGEDGSLRGLPGPASAWLESRDLPAPAPRSFRALYRGPER
ncbi:MAG: iron-sulfur cluster-binding protein [Fimbriimonadia bacterium]|jgi:L-lactate dehydrogenase complex protein LldF